MLVSQSETRIQININITKDLDQRRVCPNKTIEKVLKTATDWHSQVGMTLLVQLHQKLPRLNVLLFFDQTDLGRFLHREVGLEPMIYLHRVQHAF